MARIRFVGRCIYFGTRWLVDLLNVVGAVLLLLAFVGLAVTGVALLDLPLPWVCVAVLAFVWIVLGEGAFHAWRVAESNAKSIWDDATPLVVDQQFVQEAVRVDGLLFVNCRFTSVTIEFAGQRPFRMDNCAFDGNTIVRAMSPPLELLLMTCVKLGMFRPDLRVYGMEGDTVVQDLQLPSPDQPQEVSTTNNSAPEGDPS